jgi:hypothetical protein
LTRVTEGLTGCRVVDQVMGGVQGWQGPHGARQGAQGGEGASTGGGGVSKKCLQVQTGYPGGRLEGGAGERGRDDTCRGSSRSLPDLVQLLVVVAAAALSTKCSCHLLLAALAAPGSSVSRQLLLRACCCCYCC